ncbi:MAG: DUF3124 domain-containing protein [Caldisericia bacterium]|nr:DUF3124 domain-containing protein [Caldisericia bacterium]
MFKLIRFLLVFLIAVLVISCESRKQETETKLTSTPFNPEILKIPDKGGRKLKGQVLYMPVYSNVPFLKKQKYDLSAFIAIHNTDLTNKIKLTMVNFFNTEGKLVKTYIESEQYVNPLSTSIFEVSIDDQSGTGANFLVEWMSEEPVNEPLIESVMKDLKGNLGLSFLSTGRILREVP